MPDQDPFAEAEAALRTHALGFPGATEEFPWGHRAIKVRGKIFVTLAALGDQFRTSMKLPDSGTYALTQRYATPAGYGLGRHGWVTCTFRPGDEVPTDLLEEWIEESYRAVAPKKLILARNAQLGGAEVSPVTTLSPTLIPEPNAAKKARRGT
ncbi:MmcQ/YjbR family DNA-binding protein [Gemmata sp. JC673]|uniref:MmcQ/YjbR family DNA-binding protein n=1 Tax=Gemmata algarum TaxID=2975278 RepID=A0ABU5F5A2_9BACT|nr:MmcQ/YjbR family DNA-binding protein [Gemmata algarum]MDY3562490.1 MmcQ/YjbR family DNA-binding protein [Gemmata algarum]